MMNAISKYMNQPQFKFFYITYATI